MNTIKFHRIAIGLTQASLGARVRTTQPIISAIENGTRKPTPELERRLRDVLSIPDSRSEEQR